MRLLLGIIFGVFLTVGFAYLYDASTTTASEPAAKVAVEQRPMVNWDVVSGNWQGWSLSVRNTWHKIAARQAAKMHRSLDMELIFPIRDEPSAQLMSLKAECLQSAGLISKREERAVLGKAAKALTASNGKPTLNRSDRTPVA